MKNACIVLLCLALFSCKGKEMSQPLYTDLFRFNLKGNVQTIQDSVFVVDSTDIIWPDSVHYELGEYKKGFLEKYTTTDSSGKNTSYAYYKHFKNGLWKELKTVTNGKTVDSISIELDKAGNYLLAKDYDSSGKMTFYKDLKQNMYGMLTEGKIYNNDSTLKSSFSDNYSDQHYTGSLNYDSTGKETYRSRIKLNNNGDPMEEVSVTTVKDSTTTTVKKFMYDYYDETGNWIQRTELNKQDKPVKIIKRKIIYTGED